MDVDEKTGGGDRSDEKNIEKKGEVTMRKEGKRKQNNRKRRGMGRG